MNPTQKAKNSKTSPNIPAGFNPDDLFSLIASNLLGASSKCSLVMEGANVGDWISSWTPLVPNGISSGVVLSVASTDDI